MKRLLGQYVLPDEVLEIILLRVPGDSLIGLKCVNRSWYNLVCSLLNDPLFVANHLHTLNNNNNSASLLFSRPCKHVGHQSKHCNNPQYSLFNAFTDDGDDDRIRSLVFEDVSLPLLPDSWLVACHCDGIICLDRFDSRSIMLCNPVLREFRLLPKSNFYNWSCMGMGFGYDSRAKDYKFVRIFQWPRVEAEVYRLATDSWKQINVLGEHNPDIEISEGHDYLYWKGVCYWSMNDYYMILCFDMSYEVFRTIPLPNDMMKWPFFGVWNDLFALCWCSEEGDNNSNSSSIEIWVLDKDFDVIKSVFGEASWTWMKHIVVGPQVGRSLLWTFWNTDVFIMEDEEDEGLFAYNFRTQKLGKIAVDGPICFPICFYVKSLVSIKRVGAATRTVQAQRRRAKRRHC